MKRLGLVVVALLVAGCQTGVAPTPQIIYVTPAPTTTAAPTTAAPTPVVTPQIVYVTPAPTLAPTAAPATASPLSHTIKGTLTLIPMKSYTNPRNSSGNFADCIGLGGYSDIHSGMTVTVKDGTGVIIATGATQYDEKISLCGFTFEIQAPDAPFYSIEVGHRGGLTYSQPQLAAKGWRVDLTLG